MTITADHDLITPTAYLVVPDGIDEDAWLATRRRGIGSADIAAIVGLDKYTAPLGVYFDKRGEYERPRSARLEEAARFGHRMETVIADEFADRSGFNVHPTPGTVANAERPWMLATVDRLLSNPALPGSSVFGPLEIKNRSAYQEDDWEEDVPAGPFLQTQWQLAVTGYRRAYVAALIGGNHLIYHRVNRDEELIGNLVAIAEEFWGWVQDGNPPPPDSSEALAELLGQRYAAVVPDPIVVDPAAVDPWIAQRAEAKAEIKRQTALVTEAENHLKTIAGHHDTVIAAGRTAFTWKRHTRTDIDRDRMRADDIYDDYATTSTYRKLHVPKASAS